MNTQDNQGLVKKGRLTAVRRTLTPGHHSVLVGLLPGGENSVHSSAKANETPLAKNGTFQVPQQLLNRSKKRKLRELYTSYSQPTGVVTAVAEEGYYDQFEEGTSYAAKRLRRNEAPQYDSDDAVTIPLEQLKGIKQKSGVQSFNNILQSQEEQRVVSIEEVPLREFRPPPPGAIIAPPEYQTQPGRVLLEESKGEEAEDQVLPASDDDQNTQVAFQSLLIHDTAPDELINQQEAAELIQSLEESMLSLHIEQPANDLVQAAVQEEEESIVTVNSKGEQVYSYYNFKQVRENDSEYQLGLVDASVQVELLPPADVRDDEELVKVETASVGVGSIQINDDEVLSQIQEVQDEFNMNDSLQSEDQDQVLDGGNIVVNRNNNENEQPLGDSNAQQLRSNGRSSNSEIPMHELFSASNESVQMAIQKLDELIQSGRDIFGIANEEGALWYDVQVHTRIKARGDGGWFHFWEGCMKGQEMHDTPSTRNLSHVFCERCWSFIPFTRIDQHNLALPSHNLSLDGPYQITGRYGIDRAFFMRAARRNRKIKVSAARRLAEGNLSMFYGLTRISLFDEVMVPTNLPLNCFLNFVGWKLANNLPVNLRPLFQINNLLPSGAAPPQNPIPDRAGVSVVASDPQQNQEVQDQGQVLLQHQQLSHSEQVQSNPTGAQTSNLRRSERQRGRSGRSQQTMRQLFDGIRRPD